MFDISKVDVHYEYILNGKAILENDKNVTGVINAGEYTVNAIFTVKDPNYASIEPKQALLVIKKKTIDTSWFDFSTSTQSQITKGEKATFEFCANAAEGLNLQAGIYEVDDQGNTTLIKMVALTPDENGEKFVIEFKTSTSETNETDENETPMTEAVELEAGTYACIITVATDSANYVLMAGNTSLEYRFDFEIIE